MEEENKENEKILRSKDTLKIHILVEKGGLEKKYCRRSYSSNESTMQIYNRMKANFGVNFDFPKPQRVTFVNERNNKSYVIDDGKLLPNESYNILLTIKYKC